MKNNITKKVIKFNRNVRGKGKVFTDCYLEHCTIKTDEHTVIESCYLHNVKLTGRTPLIYRLNVISNSC